MKTKFILLLIVVFGLTIEECKKDETDSPVDLIALTVGVYSGSFAHLIFDGSVYREDTVPGTTQIFEQLTKPDGSASVYLIINYPGKIDTINDVHLFYGDSIVELDKTIVNPWSLSVVHLYGYVKGKALTYHYPFGGEEFWGTKS
ncbi:MAG: hypothetical protein PHD61_11080 [Bacteroidales bacterium]|nr:hypothetical protein [Lentimicrobiaceae bacterium]MDD5695830.1 hypothetical protein [Bacteroidales bacterium]